MADFHTFQNSSASGDPHAALKFFLRRSLARVRTATIVMVKTVYNTGGIVGSGVVDVQPLIQQIDGQGNVTALPIVFGVPYSRIQGGTNAVILDPQVGDIGTVIFGDRDQSAVVASKGMAIPGSDRRHSLSDAWYVGTGLTETPTQYVAFNNEGINIVSPTAIKATVGSNTFTLDTSQFKVVAGGKSITINSSGIAFSGAVTGDSTATFTGDVTGQGTSLHNHLQTGVTSGTSESGPPV